MASPLPKQNNSEPLKMLTFSEMLSAVLLGKKVTRVEWQDEEEYAFMLNGYLSIHTKGNDHTFLVNEKDMTAIDWIILVDKKIN